MANHLTEWNYTHFLMVYHCKRFKDKPKFLIFDAFKGDESAPKLVGKGTMNTNDI